MSKSEELRDIFAIITLHALMMEQGYKPDVCKKAYEIADQMLDERDK